MVHFLLMILYFSQKNFKIHTLISPLPSSLCIYKMIKMEMRLINLKNLKIYLDILLAYYKSHVIKEKLCNVGCGLIT